MRSTEPAAEASTGPASPGSTESPPPSDVPFLEPWQVELLAETRRAALATIATDGRPRLVPVCYAMTLDHRTLFIALDEKPKSVPHPRDLARARDILRDPRVSLIVDRWSEDWSGLAWLRLDGRADLIEPGEPDHWAAIGRLHERYPQYLDQALEDRPIIRVAIERAVAWQARP